MLIGKIIPYCFFSGLFVVFFFVVVCFLFVQLKRGGISLKNSIANMLRSAVMYTLFHSLVMMPTMTVKWNENSRIDCAHRSEWTTGPIITLLEYSM